MIKPNSHNEIMIHKWFAGTMNCRKGIDKWMDEQMDIYLHWIDGTKQEIYIMLCTRWGHQIETLSAVLALCAGNSPVTGEFPSERPVTRSFDAFFHLCLNKRMSKQSCGWWFETPSRSLWRHCNASGFGATYHFLCQNHWQETTIFNMASDCQKTVDKNMNFTENRVSKSIHCFATITHFRKLHGSCNNFAPITINKCFNIPMLFSFHRTRQVRQSKWDN